VNQPYKDYDLYNEHTSNQPKVNAGFRVGLICGLILGILHIVIAILLSSVFPLLTSVLWLVKLFIYYMGGRTAAQMQYDSQRDSLNMLRGVQSAGMGAAMVTSILSWILIFVGAILGNLSGKVVLFEPISLCISIFLDVLIAIGLGSLGGKQIADRYKVFQMD